MLRVQYKPSVVRVHGTMLISYYRKKMLTHFYLKIKDVKIAVSVIQNRYSVQES